MQLTLVKKSRLWKSHLIQGSLNLKQEQDKRVCIENHLQGDKKFTKQRKLVLQINFEISNKIYNILN